MVLPAFGTSNDLSLEKGTEVAMAAMKGEPLPYRRLHLAAAAWAGGCVWEGGNAPTWRTLCVGPLACRWQGGGGPAVQGEAAVGV